MWNVWLTGDWKREIEDECMMGGFKMELIGLPLSGGSVTENIASFSSTR